jgi:anaerobic selenocysteine-containing dehydrogenase
MPETKYSVCALDCPDCCAIKATTENGRLTKIQGDPNHPITRGFLCAKVATYLDRQYSPDRLLHPMKRIGDKGQAKFTQITWDEALDTIAARFQKITKEFGPEAILPYSYGGNMGYLNGSGMDRRFFHRLGASQLDRTICASAGSYALNTTYGTRFGTDPEQFPQSKLIIAWGANIMGTSVHLWPFILEAKRNGAHFIVIDPVKNKTGQLADWFIPINPGSDAALVLGIMHILFRDQLVDREYLTHADNLEELVEDVQHYTPAKVSAWTGISVADIERLAHLYGTTTPAVIRANYGLQRTQWGATAMRLVSLLPVITGQWKHIGGGFNLSTSGAFEINRSALERPDLMNLALGRPARTINMSLLGQALTETNDPPVEALFVYNSNPASVAPNQKLVRQGLSRNDLFTVVSEQFLTDTAEFADIVLPATTFLENTDCYLAYGHYYLQMAEATVDPPGEAKSNSDLFRLLAQRMGFTEQPLRDSDTEIIDQLLASESPFLKGITRERLESERSIRLNVGEQFRPFAGGEFRTSSGRINVGLQGFQYAPPDESRFKPLNGFRLEFIPSKADDGMNSTFGHRRENDDEMATLIMHPTDAAFRQLRSGQEVNVFNDRATCRFRIKVADEVRQGVVAARGLTWARHRPDGQPVNALVSDRLTDFGGGATFFQCQVEVVAVAP